MPFKTAPFWSLGFFFFFTVHETASFHLKEKGGKMCHSPNQSSICDLFNQVLICNFDLKNNAIASLPKIKQ
jgi:hypothetical protein